MSGTVADDHGAHIGIDDRAQQDIDALIGNEPADEKHQRSLALRRDRVSAHANIRCRRVLVRIHRIGHDDALAAERLKFLCVLGDLRRGHYDAGCTPQHSSQERSIEHLVAPLRPDNFGMNPEDERLPRANQCMGDDRDRIRLVDDDHVARPGEFPEPPRERRANSHRPDFPDRRHACHGHTLDSLMHGRRCFVRRPAPGCRRELARLRTESDDPFHAAPRGG
jgi:hypothetical protein